MNKETISKIKHAFYSYLDEDQRISVKLQLCMSLVQPSSLFLPILQSILKKITQPLKLLRMLIFLHNCYIHHLLPASVVLVVLPLITKQSKPCKTFRLDLIIHKQVLPTYMLYLQKCYQSIQQSQCAEYELFMDPIQKIYRNINMLKLGLSFIDVIYTFGRYFQRDFGFAADLNITLAVDFTRLYQHKIKLVLKANRDLWDEGMKIELEKLHERMYIVYYNCYYYKHLIGLTPRFIQTEHPHQTASKSLIKLPQREPPQQKTHSPNKKQSLNMSLSTAFSFNMSTKLKADPLNRSNYKNMSNSTVIGLTAATGSAIKNKYNLENVSKIDILKNNCSVLYADASQGCVVSQFTCDLSDKKEELVQDLDQSQGSQCQGQNHGDDDPFALLQCMEKVVAAMDNQTFNQQVKV